MTNRGNQGQGSRGSGCTPIMIGAVLLVFVILIGMANILDEGAGWAVVVRGGPVVVLSVILLLVWPWAMNNLDRQHRQRDYQEKREGCLRELQVRGLEGSRSNSRIPLDREPASGRRMPENDRSPRSPRRYCTNCGAAARTGDRFCAARGHKLVPE